MYTDTQQVIRNTLWNFMGSIMEASGYDNDNKKQVVTAIVSEELCKFCKSEDEKTVDIDTAKPILKAAKWIIDAKFMEAKANNDVSEAMKLNSLLTSLSTYIDRL